MAKGYSLHLGLNKIDPAHYGNDGALRGCINDANEMAALAKGQGYEVDEILIDEAATSDAVIKKMTKLADRLVAGDILLLTYSGHGSQVNDIDGDEGKDRLDETWCLYDRMLIDDELYRLFGRFADGVRILMLSDSCHSGSVARALMDKGRSFDSLAEGVRQASKALAPGAKEREGYDRVRVLPIDVAARAYRRNKSLYRTVQAAASGAEQAEIGAGVILISGCQDSELSLDGERNGLFTETLLDTWDKGRFRGTYGDFRQAILQDTVPHQTPNLFRVGRVSKAFLKQKPFAI